MPRLAWFSPLPPTRSGIATYSAEVLPLLAADYAIDVFTETGQPGPQPCPVYPGHEFVWRNFKDPYDLVVYQLGNATCHEFIWPHLARYPGLVVLHDAQLHHSRAKALLQRGRFDHYREEFRYSHPDWPEGLDDFVRLDLADALYYYWPMLRVPARAARLLAVHNPRLALALEEAFGVETKRIRMGITDPLGEIGPPLPAALRSEDIGAVTEGQPIRERHDIPQDAVVFAAFGLVTPEKRIPQVLRALAALPPGDHPVHLLLVGGLVGHYDVMSEAKALGVADRVTVTGYVSDAEMHRYFRAADVVLSLRWPTGRETSGTWLQAIAAGRPTIITELTHQDEVAWMDPRTWTVEASGWHEASDPDRLMPACVAIDILDEDHSLRLAMRRLASDPALRARLGAQARRHWTQTHTLACMAADYRAVIEAALARPVVRRPDLPRHFRLDGTERAREVAAPFGVPLDFLGALDHTEGGG